jgi:uncharacterized DUF497 family protein
LVFEWDPDKASANSSKHGVSFEEAATVFQDLLFIQFLDEEHMDDEDRFITIGISVQNRLLAVAHTDRNDRIRLISARQATARERTFYEQAE